ncbi:hypothetical protein NDU88_001577, partial [Pleurodeles waltl]
VPCCEPGCGAGGRMHRSSVGTISGTADYLICPNCRKALRRQERKISVSLPITGGPSAFIPEK